MLEMTRTAPARRSGSGTKRTPGGGAVSISGTDCPKPLMPLRLSNRDRVSCSRCCSREQVTARAALWKWERAPASAASRAASVGASIVARMHTSSNAIPGKTTIPTPTPSAIQSGRPISSMRAGIRAWDRKVTRSVFAASMKSTSARVKSAITRSSTALTSMLRNHKP